MYDQTKKSSHVHNICKFMSLKNDAVVRTQSLLEFDFCFHLEYNSDIARYHSQPFGFQYRFNNRLCRYTPDFLVESRNSEAAFFEVKHSSQILKPDFRARFAEKQRISLGEHGKRLILVTEKQIRLDPVIGNLKLLHRYSGLQTITEVQKAILKFVRKHQRVTLLDVALSLGTSESETLISALSWISNGTLKTNIRNTAFGLDSVVWS
ncbi:MULTISPECIES: TnsA endonuclease N-terminal domain-containing protein [Echinimonadaceae]|uniref:Tn7 transposase TnsA N-terminal domain-containing protein n=2 Tax=Echinimonadaceae TaxID=3046600 RepID=A0A8J6QPZ2_9GAMM|nr:MULTISPECIES: TnsA endonuclease N-terminal domain-containing protein [Echinimonadaceae]MBD1388384.1 Tn7 transposase TnsA N-terminal domain-containing protein [Neiella litorisoli]MCM2679786.1 Tn7 transposase TnsA N-terminal domain-containing protein [Echinimonas agarilytica]